MTESITEDMAKDMLIDEMVESNRLRYQLKRQDHELAALRQQVAMLQTVAVTAERMERETQIGKDVGLVIGWPLFYGELQFALAAARAAGALEVRP